MFSFVSPGGIHHETTLASKPPSSKYVSSIRSDTVDKLWKITENLNILYRDNWTQLAAQEIMEFQDKLMEALRKASPPAYIPEKMFEKEHRWSFSSSFLYSLTLITTIGKLNVCKKKKPKSNTCSKRSNQI